MPTVTVGDANIPYQVRRSSRARRVRLVVTPGRIEVVAPPGVSERRIASFVEAKRHWLYAKTEALRERALEVLPPRLVSGASILLRGERTELRVGSIDGERSRLRYASTLEVWVPVGLDAAGRDERVRRLVAAWLREQARNDARELVELYAPRLGVAPTRLRIGDQKTLWGSCSSRGTISLNWRLVAAPRTIFEYVVVHELCHLVERNHSKRFWALVESLLPDYRERRAWLKKHGVALG